MNLCEPVIDWQKISQQVQAGIGLVLLDFKCKMLLFTTYSYIKKCRCVAVSFECNAEC